MIDKINPISIEIRRLLNDKNYLDLILFEGSEKANVIASKKIEKWIGLDPKDFCNEIMLRNYKRNESLVNLALIPSAIVNQINEKYDNYRIPPRSGLLNYFIKNRLKNLTDRIGEF